MKVHPFIEAERTEGRSVSRTCELLKVSKAAYYQARQAVPGPRACSDVELLAKITEVHRRSRGTYGSPRVRAELRRRGECCGRNRVARLMKLHGLEGHCKRRWRATTVTDKDEQTALDLLQRHFGPSAELDRPYVGGITYVWTWQNFAYLTRVVDLASRTVVGWAVADHMRTMAASVDLDIEGPSTRHPTAGPLRLFATRYGLLGA